MLIVMASSQRPPNSTQFIVESKWLFVPNLKRLAPGIPEISSSREGHIRTDVQVDNPKTTAMAIAGSDA